MEEDNSDSSSSSSTVIAAKQTRRKQAVCDIIHGEKAKRHESGETVVPTKTRRSWTL